MSIQRFSILALFVSGLLLCQSSATAEEQPPNIVYFFIDDMGYADCGFNGGTDVKTPHIDALARSGTTMTSFYAQPVCSPARAALMTGRLATHTGTYTVILPGSPNGVPLSERFLPQALVDAGYTTSICGKWHLGETQKEYLPMQRGFQHQYGHMFGNLDYFTHIRTPVLDWYRDEQPLEEEGYTTDLIAEEACRMISAQPADKPLFLYIPFNAIHTPLQVLDRYKAPYADLPEPRQTVAGMIASLDEAISNVVAALEAKAMRDNTLIIFTSDNGGSLPGKHTNNGPLRGGKGSIYEGGIRVCAFAAWEGHIPAGATTDEALHLIDWFPTLVNVAGGSVDQPLPLDGLDIMPVLTSGDPSPHEDLLVPGLEPHVLALRSGDWKLLVNAGRKVDREKPSLALYHLGNDIGEKIDLAETYPDKLQSMYKRVLELTADAVADNGGMISPTHDTSGTPKKKR